jgi:hypothetical protein
MKTGSYALISNPIDIVENNPTSLYLHAMQTTLSAISTWSIGWTSPCEVNMSRMELLAFASYDSLTAQLSSSEGVSDDLKQTQGNAISTGVGLHCATRACPLIWKLIFNRAHGAVEKV